jgi:hypothetical protein
MAESTLGRGSRRACRSGLAIVQCAVSVESSSSTGAPSGAAAAVVAISSHSIGSGLRVIARASTSPMRETGYGAFTITKAISIQGHGFAGIGVTGGATGITINATATDAVSLNGLLMEGSGLGANGIMFTGGNSLVVENCVVRNVVGSGLFFASSGTTLQTPLRVQFVFYRRRLIEPQSSGRVTAAVERVALYGNRIAGLYLNAPFGTASINVAVTDSVAANIGGTGFVVHSPAGHSVSSLVLTRSTAAGNLVGVAASEENATLRIAQSTITGNSIGYRALSGGVILSYVENYIDANGTNIGTLGSATKQ